MCTGLNIYYNESNELKYTTFVSNYISVFSVVYPVCLRYSKSINYELKSLYWNVCQMKYFNLFYII